jgi:peptide chain release factor
MELIQFSAGQGPSECALAVALGFKTFAKELEKVGLNVDIIEQEPGYERNTFKSVMLALKNDDLSFDQKQVLEAWDGTMQWICKSPYRPKHGRKNWFFNVVHWNIDSSQPANLSDFEVRTCKASGSGGQHVNTTDSAVQILHKPSGLAVKVSTERSQHQNKRLAWALIQHKLESQTQDRQAVLKGDMRMQHHQLERGKPVRVFEGMKFKEKT